MNHHLSETGPKGPQDNQDDRGSMLLSLTSGEKNMIVNILSFFCFLVVISTGIFVLKRLPGQSTLLGFSKHSWKEVHENFGILMVALVGLHLVLHRKWIASLMGGKLMSGREDRGGSINRYFIWFALGVSFILMGILVMLSLLEE